MSADDLVVPRTGATVLVVEDEVLIAMDREDCLIELGFTVIGPATTVTTAMKLLAEHHPDAAILDYTLRGEAVTPVAAQLKAMGIPFIMATGRDPGMLTDTALTGIQNIGKIVDPKILKNALEGLMSEARV